MLTVIGQMPHREIRADFDEHTIVVYQAYSTEIADSALAAQRLVPPFNRNRMTWIKPSFLWMMHRSGWATKPGQERILGVRVTRSGFELALTDACLSHFDPTVYASHESWQARLANSPVRVQWDPERDISLSPMSWRSLQIGLGPPVVPAYVEEWTVSIDDVTPLAQRLGRQSADERQDLPQEKPYPLPPAISCTVGADSRPT